MANPRPSLAAEKREIKGKQVKRLRRHDRIPAVVYGKGFDPELVAVPAREFRRLYQDVGSNTLVDLDIEAGESYNVLIHEPDRHPVTSEELHVDFYRVRMDEKIRAEVPLHFTGEAPAVRALDGSLLKNLDAIEVECLPGDLPSHVEVSLEPLADFEASVHVSDLEIPEGVELLTDPEEMVVRVEPPRSEEELEALEEVPEEETEAIEQIGDAEERPEGEEEEGAAGESKPAEAGEKPDSE